jgi:hypothetical protein
LLVVGSRDEQVIDFNLQASSRMNCPRQLRLIAGATHLFEEPGTLEEVATLAADWFERHLKRDGQSAN